MKVRILYFASLRDAAGRDGEDTAVTSADARGLDDVLRQRHGVSMPVERLRVAITGEFSGWDRLLRDGDEIAFLPPMSGG